MSTAIFQEQYTAKTSTRNALLVVGGALLGSIITQLFLPTANWHSCRQLGIESAAQPCLTGPPTLEIFSSQYETYEHTRVNGTYNQPSAFRGPPHPDVDASWETYWRTWIFSVSEETFQASLPQHPAAAVRLAGGKYLATFEATHQLHCLYNLFRASYRDLYPEEQADYEKDPRMWHERVDHCTEILRQKLECDRDTTILTYNWVRGKRSPVLNFNAARVCPRWGPLDDFAKQNREDRLPKKPANAVELEETP